MNGLDKDMDSRVEYYCFNNISYRRSFKQTAQTLMRRRIMRRLIWVYAVDKGFFLYAKHKWVTLLTEPFVAHPAFKRLLPRVNPDVGLQLVAIRDILTAK
ncbi:hypothetical protein DPMN_112094 [Dreissena polymorpha]|uniref:Uncharacterized protein n=1 Tax=Dreissena polymorpha TaxID=45954 RepID=A0A9D4KFQ4_DREPO|nr:hypothetical protein DPMN_112094 [Dreissena polymorpha]